MDAMLYSGVEHVGDGDEHDDDILCVNGDISCGVIWCGVV